MAHFPQLRTPTLFVHGTADPFGAVTELRAALGRIPAATALHLEAGVGHDLGAGRRSRAALAELATRVADRWLEFTADDSGETEESSTPAPRAAREAAIVRRR